MNMIKEQGSVQGTIGLSEIHNWTDKVICRAHFALKNVFFQDFADAVTAGANHAASALDDD